MRTSGRMTRRCSTPRSSRAISKSVERLGARTSTNSTNFLDLLRNGNANNYGRYKNPKFDTLLDQANQEVDLTKRGQLLAQAEQLALDDYALVPTLFWVSGELVRPYVKNWEPNPTDTHRTRWVTIDEQARAATPRQ